jgi:protein-S-isoprenylcysteine O-methyltransferase Ste14
MLSLDSIRSFAGTFLLALYLPVPFYMVWIHAPHTFWKRVGPVSYALHWVFYIAMVVAVIRLYDMWRWRAWEWPVVVTWVGLFPLAVAAWLAWRTYTTINLRTLLTFRQIRPNGERRLIREGILGTIRHPRYVMFTLLALANVTVTGYPLVLASLVVTVALFAVVIHLEESELREYFGEEFEAYRRSVPAFFPRIKAHDEAA